MSVFVDEEVQAEEVVVTKHGCVAVGEKQFVELPGLFAHFRPIAHVDGLAFEDLLLVAGAFLVEAEEALHLGA